MISYVSPAARVRAEIEIQRSRFIADLFPVSSPEDATDILAGIRKEFYDATHHCSAFRIGTELPFEKASDDGEPQGTAGHPMLRLLRMRDITNVGVVVTRYFGGIKLGTGGLSRAYAAATGAALESATILCYTPHQRVRFHLPYDLVGAFENALKDTAILVRERNFSETVSMICLIPTEETDHFLHTVTELSAARIEAEVLGEEYVPLEK